MEGGRKRRNGREKGERGIEIEQRKERDPQAQPPRLETLPGERKLRRGRMSRGGRNLKEEWREGKKRSEGKRNRDGKRAEKKERSRRSRLQTRNTQEKETQSYFQYSNDYKSYMISLDIQFECKNM